MFKRPLTGLAAMGALLMAVAACSPSHHHHTVHHQTVHHTVVHHKTVVHHVVVHHH